MADMAPVSVGGTVQGSSGNDVLHAASSITFDWVPDPGDSRTEVFRSTYPEVNYETGEHVMVTYISTQTMPATMSGSLIFQGVSLGEAFTTAPTSFPDVLYIYRPAGGEWS